MRTLRLILLPLILIFALALLILWLPLPRPAPPPFSDGRNLLAAALTGLLGAGLAAFRRSGEGFDSVFQMRGLAAGRYHLFGRSYRGLVDGRVVKVVFLPPRSLQRALLNMTVSAKLAGRMAVGARTPLLDCRDCQPVEDGWMICWPWPGSPRPREVNTNPTIALVG